MYEALNVSAGSLRHVVTIQTLNRTTGDQWTVTDQTDRTAGWTTLYTTRASIEPIGGLGIKETLTDGDLSSTTTHVIWLRYQAAYQIVPGMQVLFGNKVYRVQIARDWFERHRLWQLLVIQVPA